MVDSDNSNNNITSGTPDDDVLRSEDIIPPFTKKPWAKNQRPQTNSSPDIPKFDLADDIMAEQRKTISIKRKSPTQKFQQPQQSGPIQQPPLDKQVAVPLSEEDRLIRELVAQDIERLCRGENPDN